VGLLVKVASAKHAIDLGIISYSSQSLVDRVKLNMEDLYTRSLCNSIKIR
jgi:hypothetical protein